MDHAQIDENQIADRYLMGKLTDEERRRFEEHFVDCPRCLEQLETVEGFRGALKEVEAEEFSVAPTRGPSAFLERLEPPRTRPVMAFLAAACLLLAILSSVFFYSETRRTRRDLAGVREASEQARRRQDELEQALQREQAARARLSDAAVALRAAPVAASVFVLNLTRGQAPAEPENRVVLGESAGWVALVFDRPERPGFQSYRVRLSTTERGPIGDAVTVRATSSRMLAVSLPSSLLGAGDYFLSVEGIAPGRAEELATYRFRVVPGK